MKKTLLLLLFLSGWALFPSGKTGRLSKVKAVPGKDVRTIPPDVFGFNGKTISGPPFSDKAFQKAVARLYPGFLRYPGGTVGNYFDWHTGNFIPRTGRRPTKNPMLLGEYLTGMPAESSLIYMVNLARPVPETGIPADTTEEVLKSQTVLNKKIADILKAVDSMSALGKFPTRIELGNEFYFNNDAAAIYAANPDLYLDHAAQLARALRQKFDNPAYPPFQIAVIASKGGTTSREKWDNAVFNRFKTDARFAKDVNAVTMHWYINGRYGPAEDPSDAAGCMELIAQGAKNVKNQTLADYNKVPEGVNLWSTEYGTKGTYTVGNGTWADGMRAVAMALNYFGMGSKMQVLAFHNIRIGRVIDDDNVVGPVGYALALVNHAARGKHRATNLLFNPNPAFCEDFPSLLGWKFENDSLVTLVIANFSDKTVDTLDISGLLNTGDSLYLIQRYSLTPWQKNVNENTGIRQTAETLLSSFLKIEPFSVTYVEQKKGALGIKTPRQNRKSDIVLFSNFPNPFHQKTTIRYALSRPCFVDLCVYDFTGKKVAALAEGLQPAGLYNKRFDAGNLPSGLYFCSLSTGRQTAFKKMLLTRN